jgi:hypothetical protein
MEKMLLIFYVSIVSVYSCLLFNIPDKEYCKMVVLTVLTVLILYVGQQFILSGGKVRKANNQYHVIEQQMHNDSNKIYGVEHFEGFDDSFKYIKSNMDKAINNSPKDMNEIVSGKLMGPYDGKCLDGNNSNEKYKWMKTPYTTPLLDNTGFVVQGSTGPLQNRLSDDSYLTGPHLDGTNDTSESLFMFAKNKCSPGCCPSSFSCDSGCICTTDKQREFISRGGVM